MQTTRVYAFIATVFALCVSTHGDAVVAHLALDGGTVARKNVPVEATVSGDLGSSKAAAWMLVVPGALGHPIPAQVELTDKGAIIRWVEPELLPGQAKTYDLVAADAPAEGGFRYVDGDGFRDLAYNDKGVLRHMTRFDPADHVNTFKPFHHVYGLHDEGFITNGPGSDEWNADPKAIRFPHHRGLFFGFNKTPYGDFWHGTNGVSQQFRKYDTSRQFTGPVVAREASVIEWVAKDGKPVIRDTRELTTWRVSDKEYVLDFDVTLESLTGEAIPLSGDSQHAGHNTPVSETYDGARLAQWTEFHNKVGRLEESERSVFEMHYYLGLPQAEVAKLLNLHPRKVSYLWIAATEKLADELAGLQ